MENFTEMAHIYYDCFEPFPSKLFDPFGFYVLERRMSVF